MSSKAFFIAATGQNVGKTTTCLGLMKALQQKGLSVGFMKPVGQEAAKNLAVDKDVVLFKEYFQLPDKLEGMSPVLFPRGFTRDYLDGKVDKAKLTDKILASFQAIEKEKNLVIVEGTGHTGVGSIVDLNNAQVAALLNCPMILIGKGGLGSSFDELFLNITQCKKENVPVAGVILNRVLRDKKVMIEHYMKKALAKWDIPLLGCIPFDPLLSALTLFDLEKLFQPKWIHLPPQIQCHFRSYRILSSATEIYQTLPSPQQLFILPSSKEEILLAILKRNQQDPQKEQAVLLTGKLPLEPSLQELFCKTSLPICQIPCNSFLASQMISSYTSKIQKEDTTKIEEAIQLVETNLLIEKISLTF